jgi:hypothetical protein
MKHIEIRSPLCFDYRKNQNQRKREYQKNPSLLAALLRCVYQIIYAATEGSAHPHTHGVFTAAETG